MKARMAPAARRQLIVDATLALMRRQGIAATTVRDVALEIGVSSGLVHHYFTSMDELVAAAFEQAAAQGLHASETAMAAVRDPVGKLREFFASYTRAEQDWAFQLWLDAWAEAARRPVLQATSVRLNIAWQRLVVGVVELGVAEGDFHCADPDGAAWRILSLLDGLALQTVAHQISIDRDSVQAWSRAHAELELGLVPGRLTHSD